MTGRIEGLNRVIGQFDSNVKESRDERNLSFGSLPTEVLLMAHELLKVKSQLKSGAVRW